MATRVWGARNINLEVKDKEFIVFLGPSGCGRHDNDHENGSRTLNECNGRTDSDR